MKPCFIGIDLGTSSVKVGAFNPLGESFGIEEEPIRTHSPLEGWSEQNPSLWWERTSQALKRLLGGLKKHRPLAIGMCGQTRGQVFVNKEGESLRPAIIWSDTRAQKEAYAIDRLFSPIERTKFWGYDPPIDPSFPLARLLWVKAKEPDVFRRLSKVLQPKDYLVYRLTGEIAGDDMSGFGFIHIKRKLLSLHTLHRLSIPTSIFPSFYSPLHVVGRVTDRASKETGVPKNTPVILGTMDGWCSLWGSGIHGPGVAMEVSGTSEMVGFLSNRLPPREKKGIIALPYMNRLWFYGGPTQSGGSTVCWFLRNFSKARLVSEVPLDELNSVRSILQGSEGLLVLPYLKGERAPLWDPKARGVFLGIKESHTKAHLLRAVLEGVSFSVRHILEIAEEVSRDSFDFVITSGGGAKNSIWNQIKADVLGKPVRTLQTHQSSLLGAAVLASVGIGFYSQIETAQEKMVHTRETFQPDAKRHLFYHQIYQLYNKSYQRLKGIFRKLHQIEIEREECHDKEMVERNIWQGEGGYWNGTFSSPSKYTSL